MTYIASVNFPHVETVQIFSDPGLSSLYLNYSSSYPRSSSNCAPNGSNSSILISPFFYPLLSGPTYAFNTSGNLSLVEFNNDYPVYAQANSTNYAFGSNPYLKVQQYTDSSCLKALGPFMAMAAMNQCYSHINRTGFRVDFNPDGMTTLKLFSDHACSTLTNAITVPSSSLPGACIPFSGVYVRVLMGGFNYMAVSRYSINGVTSVITIENNLFNCAPINANILTNSSTLHEIQVTECLAAVSDSNFTAFSSTLAAIDTTLPRVSLTRFKAKSCDRSNSTNTTYAFLADYSCIIGNFSNVASQYSSFRAGVDFPFTTTFSYWDNSTSCSGSPFINLESLQADAGTTCFPDQSDQSPGAFKLSGFLYPKVSGAFTTFSTSGKPQLLQIFNSAGPCKLSSLNNTINPRGLAVNASCAVSNSTTAAITFGTAPYMNVQEYSDPNCLNSFGPFMAIAAVNQCYSHIGRSGFRIDYNATQNANATLSVFSDSGCKVLNSSITVPSTSLGASSCIGFGGVFLRLVVNNVLAQNFVISIPVLAPKAVIPVDTSAPPASIQVCSSSSSCVQQALPSNTAAISNTTNNALAASYQQVLSYIAPEVLNVASSVTTSSYSSVTSQYAAVVSAINSTGTYTLSYVTTDVFDTTSFVGNGISATSLEDIVVTTDALPASIPQSQIAPGATPQLAFTALLLDADDQVSGLIIGFSIEMQDGYTFSKRSGQLAYFTQVLYKSPNVVTAASSTSSTSSSATSTSSRTSSTAAAGDTNNANTMTGMTNSAMGIAIDRYLLLLNLMLNLGII